jgi:hypothetical protein
MHSQSLFANSGDYSATESDADPVRTPAYDQLALPDYFFLDGASFLDEAVDGII